MSNADIERDQVRLAASGLNQQQPSQDRDAKAAQRPWACRPDVLEDLAQRVALYLSTLN